MGCTSDREGNYKLTVPAGKELEIQISFTGYKTVVQYISLKPEEQKRLNFWLASKSFLLKGIEIQDNVYINSGLTRIDPIKLNDLVGAKPGVEMLIKMLPSVSSSNELTSQYSVRGGNFDENLVYINEIEVYRPFLIRSGEQEGLSIINPDMVGNILFSAGGFSAVYGDKMSSVLDITYKKPQKFGGKVSASLLGATAYVEGLIKQKIGFNIGFRQQSNQYILNAMETKGSYRPSFTDLQSYLTYSISLKSEISFLGIYSRNVYRFVPEDRTTNFGSAFQPMKLKVYFDGQEVDQYSTLLGAGTYTYKPSDKTILKFIVSAFNSNENEIYDIQSQYWLSETVPTADKGNDDAISTEIDKGVGTFLEHSRDYLTYRVFNLEHKGLRIMGKGSLNWGFRYQHEYVNDKMSEWKMVDSAGYTIPYIAPIPGDANPPTPPVLQNVLKSENTISSNRIMSFVQKNWEFDAKDTSHFNLTGGIRFQYWDYNNEFLLSPRASISYKPNWENNILFRFATGVYNQSPLYREYRDKSGNVNDQIKAQNSYHFISGMDWNFYMWSRKFVFITEAYYKYMTNLIPYEIDNLKIRYSAENSAVGYVAGIDFRLNGEFVEGIESWASMTLMQTQENIDGDGIGYIPRPTDQRFMFKLFLQDYIPKLPWIRMSLNFVYGTGVPFTRPNQTDFSETHRLPSYMRVDWATSFRLKGPSSKWARNNVFKYLNNIWLYFEVFNLFQNDNTVSYLWVTDYDNRYYAVPNYLTPRQFNVRLTIDF